MYGKSVAEFLQTLPAKKRVQFRIAVEKLKLAALEEEEENEH
jgi:hypothetical protein